MSWFAEELDSAVMLWRLERSDGVTLGFAAHDRDIWRGGLLYRAAPGIRPSAIELHGNPQAETMDVEGVLSSDTISDDDLAAGRWDRAHMAIGIADWQDASRGPDWLIEAEFGEIVRREGAFQVELLSGKRSLDNALCPRTSPSCRAEFGDHDCGVSRARFRRIMAVTDIDAHDGAIGFSGVTIQNAQRFVEGQIRWHSGENRGLAQRILRVEGAYVCPVDPPYFPVRLGDIAEITQGCDKTLSTCRTRYNNVVNFRGEPHLPGNDLLTRFPA